MKTKKLLARNDKAWINSNVFGVSFLRNP